jgi:hypothetical protein
VQSEAVKVPCNFHNMQLAPSNFKNRHPTYKSTNSILQVLKRILLVIQFPKVRSSVVHKTLEIWQIKTQKCQEHFFIFVVIMFSPLQMHFRILNFVLVAVVKVDEVRLQLIIAYYVR